MAVARTRIICGDLQGELQVFQQGSEPCYRVVPDESAQPGMHQPAGHLDNGRAFYLPSAFESMSGRQRSQNWKKSVHVLQDGVKGETLLRWLKRQGVIQLGAEWHRHLYDLPAPPKQPSKATAALRSMRPMQEGGSRTVPAAASAADAPEGPARTAAPAAARQEPAVHEAAAAPAAPATPAAHRPKPGHSEAAKGLAPAAKPGHSEPGKGLAPAAEPPQQGEAVPAAESSDRADSDSDISIGMWDLPPGPPREGLPHVAVKLEEDERVADTEMKLETTTCANPPQVVGHDDAAAAKPEGSVSSDELPLIVFRRPVLLPHKQSAFTAGQVDSSRGPVQGAQSQEDASSCPPQQAQRQHMQRQSHRVLDDSEEESGAARAPGLQRKSPSSPQQLHLPRRQRQAGCALEDSDEDAEAASGPAGRAELARSPRQAQSRRRRRRLSSQVLEDSEDEAEAATAPVACPQEGRGRAAEALEAQSQSAATLGKQLQQPPGNSGRQQEGQVEGHMRATEACSAEPEEAASSGSSQQPLRARLRRRQATKRSAQHAATGAKKRVKSPVVDSPKKLREVSDSTGCQSDAVILSPPARQGSLQAKQAAHAMPASHAKDEHAADMADSAASQHTPAQGHPARTSHSLVTPVPEQDSCLREARQAPSLGPISMQSPTHELCQRQAELQARNDALEASVSAAEAKALQLQAKLGAVQSEAAVAREQLQAQLGCMRTMATASEIATATARKLLVERHALQGRLSQVLQEKVDVKAIWAGCGSRAIALKMEDLQRQLQQEAAKRVAAEQQAAKLKQQVERLQAENMQSAVSALAALQHMDQKSKNMQAEVGEIKGSLQAEIAEVVRRKGTEVAALQEQMAVLRAQNKDLSTALSRAWSCQKTAQAQLQARLSSVQSQGPAAKSGQAAGEQQSAARRQQDEGRLSHAIQAFEHAACRMNQEPVPPQGAVAATAGTSMALEAPSAAEEAHRKLQADYDALLATLGICGQLFVALGRPAVAESIMAYLQGARGPDALRQR